MGSEKVTLLTVIGEDNAGSPPTDGYCASYAADKGVDPNLTFGGDSGKTLFTYVNNYGEGGFGVPWNLILDGSTLEYVWSSTTGTGDLYGTLDELTGN